jgi:hypothetical protein
MPEPGGRETVIVRSNAVSYSHPRNKCGAYCYYYCHYYCHYYYHYYYYYY